MMRIYVIFKTAWSSGLRQPGPLGRLKMNIYSRYKKTAGNLAKECLV